MTTASQRDSVTYRYYVIMLLLAVLVAACKKTVQPSTQIPSAVTDARTIRLKQLVAEKLPSPYFYFSYDNEGFVDSISFASGFFEYKVSYQNKRVSEMLNRGNSARLIYEYKQGQVSSIIEKTAAGDATRRHVPGYDNKGKLMTIATYFFSSNRDSALEKRFDVAYYADGNLSKIAEYRRDLSTNLLVNYTNTEYSDYDNKKNIDDFYLLKDAWGHLLFLPQMKLQVNNPGTVIIKGMENDYRMSNTYEYNDQELPIVKNIRMEQIRGNNTGVVLKFKNQYTYY